MPSTYLVTSTAGPARDLAKGAREQAYWDDHAAFIDQLVAAGVILLGGPLPDEGGAVLAVRADSEAAVRILLTPDPWYAHGILTLARIQRWEVFVDQWVSNDPG